MKRIGRKTIALLLAAALALPGLSAQGAEVSVTAPAAVRAQLHEMVQSLAEQHE